MMWDGDGPWSHHGFLGSGGWLTGRATTAQHAQAPAGQYPATASPPASPPETAREIVQRRYASGEIERKEYLQRLADL